VTSSGRQPLKIARLDVSSAQKAAELVALQRAAYRLEADLVGSDRIPPLRETAVELQSCGETFLGAFDGDALVGAISWKRADDTIDLHRLVVDPARFRQGIARALVRAALAAEPDASRAVVQTGAANRPAVELYLAEGFVSEDVFEPVEGLHVARLAKRLG
jgi:GNAT superfamily N-acetyltransferase